MLSFIKVELIEKGGGVTLRIRVVPRASRSEIVGIVDDVLKIRIAAPPVDGAANDEVIKLLSKAFDISRSSVEIIGGEASRSKRIRLNGLTSAAAQAVLEKHFSA